MQNIWRRMCERVFLFVRLLVGILQLHYRLTSSQQFSGYTGIPGLWTQELDAGLWTLDSGRWTLDAGLWTLDSGRWPLDADFKDGPDIMLSELACFSETKRYFNYSTNQKQGWQFLYYRKIPHKETKHNESFKGVLKESYSSGQNSPKNNNCDAFL